MSGPEKLRAFAKSPHHAWLALLTVGAGVASLDPRLALLGLAIYALGWIYVPDLPIFARWMARRRQGETDARLDDFLTRRRELHASLRPDSRKLYDALALQIEQLQADLRRESPEPDLVQPRCDRLAGLAWTYLRLLHTADQLDDFLELENPEELREKIAGLESEIAALDTASRPHLAESLQARLVSLRERSEKRALAAASRQLTASELERVAELVQLFRADLLASRDTVALSDEIDGAARQLDRTRDWLRDLEFDTSPADIPDAVTASVPLRVET